MVTASVGAKAEVLEASLQKMAGRQTGYDFVICSDERKRKMGQRAAQIDHRNADFGDRACCLHVLNSCDDTIAFPSLEPWRRSITEALRPEIGGPITSLPIVAGDTSYHPTAIGPCCFDQDGYMTHIDSMIILVAKPLSISIKILSFIAKDFFSKVNAVTCIMNLE
jgi:hypothetical protein